MKQKIILIFLLWAISALSVSAAEGDVINVGAEAPAFTAVSTDGSTVTMASLKGQVVLVNFFATWCGPCMKEMPRIEKEVWQAYKDSGLIVVAIGREHTIAELKKFNRNKGFSFTLLEDPKRKIFSEYATQYIPRCYLIGKDGFIKFATTGFAENDFSELKRQITKELSQ